MIRKAASPMQKAVKSGSASQNGKLLIEEQPYLRLISTQTWMLYTLPLLFDSVLKQSLT